MMHTVKPCLHCQYKFWTGARQSRARLFCSEGCQSVYDSLVSAGFVKFGEFSTPRHERRLFGLFL
jgi:hypothetical protein